MTTPSLPNSHLSSLVRLLTCYGRGELRARRRPQGKEALVLPAMRASVLLTVSVVSVAANWIRHRHQHASRYRDGDGADEQKDGCEAPNCTELHGCHLPSHHLVSPKRRLVHMAELGLG